VSLFRRGAKKVVASRATQARPAARSAAQRALSTSGAAQVSLARERGLPEVRVPIDFGDPLLAELLAVVPLADWSAIRALLAKHDARSQDITCLIWNVCKQATDALSDWLPAALEAEQDDSLALAVLASLKINQGWEVRTGSRAQHVSKSQFETFHSLLGEAQDLLYRASEIDNASVVPWYLLLDLCLGLNPGVDVSERRFEAVNSRCPGNVYSNRTMFNILCRKWYGSHDAMHTFARDALRGPHALLLGELTAHAHVERWLDISDKDGRVAYMHQPEVRAELLEAAELSILQPDYAFPRNPYYAANMFAMAFGLAGMWQEAFEAFKATDGVVAGRWVYINGKDPAKPYDAWRDFVIKKL
jgi:hypothetical protein